MLCPICCHSVLQWKVWMKPRDRLVSFTMVKGQVVLKRRVEKVIANYVLLPVPIRMLKS